MSKFLHRLAAPGLALAAIILTIMTPDAALAADQLNSGDTAWIITATALVLFMTLPGLALFYGGLVRSRNVLSVLMHCVAIAVTSQSSTASTRAEKMPLMPWWAGVITLRFIEMFDIVLMKIMKG